MWAWVRDLAEDIRVVVYDRPATGVAAGHKSYTVDDLADDLHAVLGTVLRPGEQAVLAGHSMGGITIMSWARRYPAEFAERSCCGAPGELQRRANSDIHVAIIGDRLIATPRIPGYVDRRKRPADDRCANWLGIACWALPAPVRPRIRVYVVRSWKRGMLREAPQRTLREFIASLLSTDLTSSLPALTCPTVIIAGGRDRLLPPVHNRRLETEAPETSSG